MLGELQAPKNLVCLEASSLLWQAKTLLLLLWVQTGVGHEAFGNRAALKKAADANCIFALHAEATVSTGRCSSRAHPRDYTKTKPRGRSRCTSTREAPRNKSRGRADRTLVLGRRGAAAQNAGGRPGLPLTAPDTAAGTCPRGTTLRKNTPGTKERKNLAQGFGRPAMGA